jgi:hypothetical protein
LKASADAQSGHDIYSSETELLRDVVERLASND